MAPSTQIPYPLYNTTYTLHRLSPLYTPRIDTFTNASLQPYAHSLRELLAGDVLRGVRVGLGVDEDILARVGALRDVTWRLLPEEDLWEEEHAQIQDDTTMDLEGRSKGVLVEVRYEWGTYTAILLADTGSEGLVREGEGFQYFPLLMTRMPGSLRETFIQFLSSTFDVRVSGLGLGKGYLVDALEGYISDCSRDDDGEEADVGTAGRSLREVVKEVQVVIGFDLESGGGNLKTIEMLVAREDLMRLVLSGRRLERSDSTQEFPFMTALGKYIDAHLALNIKHERVKIVKIACGAFVLGADGKAKLTEPLLHDGDSVQNRATLKLVDSLVKLAKGGALSKINQR